MISNKKHNNILLSYARQKEFFDFATEEYIKHNIQLMKLVCICIMLCYCLIELVTLVMWKKIVLNYMYLLPMIVFFILFLLLNYLSNKSISAKQSMVITIICYISLMLYIIEISVFPMPNRPSAYFPLILATASIFYYIPAIWSMGINTVSCLIFTVLVLKFKDPSVYNHELFEMLVAYFISIAVIFVMVTMRIQNISTNEKYRILSEHDGLTALLNRRTGEHKARKFIEKQLEGSVSGFCMIDLDYFKDINDTYGHQEGDYWLTVCADIFSNECNKSDIITRYGGDEFFILFKNTNEKTLIDKINNIKHSLRHQSEEKDINISLSIGICIFGSNNNVFDEILSKADEALYQSKNNGKNRYTIYKIV